MSATNNDNHTQYERAPISRLEQEWQTLRRRIPSDLYRRWCEQQPILSRFANVDAIVRFLQDDGDNRGKDAVLGALLALAHEDPLAGRVVLQALLPGLKQAAGRSLFDSGEREVFWELLLAHTWARIRFYPLERRPRRVAANLLLDSVQRTLRELARERRHSHNRHDADTATSGAISALAEPELVLREAVRAQAITAVEARLIFLTRLERRALADAAASEGLAYNVARVRLQRAERRLLVFLGVRPVPRRQVNAPSSTARASGAGTAD